MSYGTVQAEKMTTESGYSLGAGNASSFKNRIINGGMVIDQRNVGAAVTVNAFTAYSVDRFLLSFRPSTGVATGQQVSDAPAGFVNSLRMTQSSVTSPAASDVYTVQQKIEGFNTADLNWGTANAKTVTVSFWAKSSVTGTYGITLQNINASRRSYVSTYTISSANTWEYKTITITGDTTGTWETTNSTGINLIWDLGSGSDYQTSTLNAWQTSNVFQATTGTRWIATSGATWQITGVQLEVGTVATSFDFRPHSTELMLCQRYYEKNASQTTAPQQGLSPSGQVYASGLSAYVPSAARLPRIRFAVTKRTSPSITFFRSAAAQGGTVDGLWSWYTAGGLWISSTGTSVVDGFTQDNEFGVEMNSANAFTTNATYLFGGTWTASAEL